VAGGADSERYGGSGLPLSAASVILEEICRSGGNAAACHAQMYVMGTLLRHGSDEQKQRWLPGYRVGSVAVTGVRGYRTPCRFGHDPDQDIRQRDREGGWVVNGQKIWTSRALHSDLMILLARTASAPAGGPRGDWLSVFLVEMRERGDELTIRPISTMMNHSTTEVFFDDLRLPADALIGEAGKGFRYILDGMNAERILIAGECIGDARFFIERASTYARLVQTRACSRSPGRTSRPRRLI
jgi:acyl-CoA dehydrogenase